MTMDDQTTVLLSVVWAFTGLSTLLALGRFYARFVIMKEPGKDDWIFSIGLLANWGTWIVTTLMAVNGFGRHSATLSPADMDLVFKLQKAYPPLSAVANGMPKISVACLLIRIMGSARRGGWFLLFITITCLIALIIPTVLVNCRCASLDQIQSYSYFSGAYPAFVDLVLALFPIWLIRDLQMNFKKKLGLCLMFGLGIVAFAFAVVKTIHFTLFTRQDATYDFVPIAIWSAIEINMVIIYACVPTLPPIFSCIRKRYRQESETPKYHGVFDRTTIKHPEPSFMSDDGQGLITHPQRTRQVSNSTASYSYSGGGANPNENYQKIPLFENYERILSEAQAITFYGDPRFPVGDYRRSIAHGNGNGNASSEIQTWI